MPHKPAIQPIAQPAIERLMLTASSVQGVEVSNYFLQTQCFDAAASPGGFSACTGSATCGYSCFDAESSGS